jgi:hypothetical protein
MARRPKSVADIDKEIAALQAQRSEALEGRAVQIGKIAAKAELNLLDIPDADLLKEFKAIAERFRAKPKPQVAQQT